MSFRFVPLVCNSIASSAAATTTSTATTTTVTVSSSKCSFEATSGFDDNEEPESAGLSSRWLVFELGARAPEVIIDFRDNKMEQQATRARELTISSESPLAPRPK